MPTGSSLLPFYLYVRIATTAILPCARFKFIASWLHRLAERTRLRPDVPDTLLRRMARRQRPRFPFRHVVSSRRDLPRALVSVSRRHFRCAHHGQIAAERCDRFANWKEGHFPRG